MVNLHQSPPTPLSPWVQRGWKQAPKRKQHIRPKKFKWHRTFQNENASIFNNAKTVCQRGKREAEEIPRKLGKVSSGKGIAVGQSWTTGTTSEPLLRRRKSTFKKQVNEGLPLYSTCWDYGFIIMGAHWLQLPFPSMLRVFLVSCILGLCMPPFTLFSLCLTRIPPTTTESGWHLPMFFFLLSSFVPSPLILRALLSLRREVGEKKSHWPLIISNKDLSPMDNCPN